jgi:hypothetical protein
MKFLLIKWALIAFSFGFCGSVFAHNTHPYSGRRLQYDHWLTCWGGEETVLRSDPPFNKNTPENIVAAYVPKFHGSYSFEVKDTWEEWVTKSGSDCFHCGSTQSCSGSGNNRSCSSSCNYCSWQELETFYRPWSEQTVEWDVAWNQSQEYRSKRQDWLKQGKPDMSRTKADLVKLLEFDPERPLEYYLFPGEVERITVGNSAGLFSDDEVITPSVSIEHARNEYKIAVESSLGSRFQCDDRDFSIKAEVTTGKRLITRIPNSIEFYKNWLVAPKDDDGNAIEEPGEFDLVDLSAMRYEQQDVSDHYKLAQVRVNLWQRGRGLWFIEGRVSKTFQVSDDQSVIHWGDQTPDEPAVATYDIKASDLLKTRYLGSQFHLVPGATYDLCTKMFRDNNIYYESYWFFNRIKWWSEYNCASFKYKAEEKNDLRSKPRKIRDFLSRFGFGFL